MDWLSLLVPIAYLSILIGSLATFSYLYRARLAAKTASLAPWFGPHVQRNIYLSLLELQSNPDTKVPDSVLRAALFRRSIEDIHRVLSIRNSKPALQQLLQRGAVGDELWQRFSLAEKEVEMELKDVVNEANAFSANWGQSIFAAAGEAAHNEVFRKSLLKIEGRRAEEKEQWEKRRESVREGFLKELDAGEGKKVGGSDDDAVLVDGVPPGETAATAAAAQQQGGGSAKKKKNKK